MVQESADTIYLGASSASAVGEVRGDPSDEALGGGGRRCGGRRRCGRRSLTRAVCRVLHRADSPYVNDVSGARLALGGSWGQRAKGERP